MRTIYLVRHGKVEFPGGERSCIGRTDIPLDHIGRLQAMDLGEYFTKHPVEAVFCSPLCRSKETAAILSGGRFPVREEEKLTELDMGEWENLPFRELKKVRSGPEQEPSRGECRRAGRERMEQAIGGILEETKGDVAVVSHAGVNCCFLSGILGVPLDVSRTLTQPYGGISRIQVEENGGYQVSDLGRKPGRAPGEAECEEIWEHYKTPERVRRHCMAVAETAVRLGNMLSERQNGPGRDYGSASENPSGLDLQLIRSAALLHDVARGCRGHAEEGERILLREGYPETADIIRQHHQLDREILNEAAVVYLADKLVMEDREVTLEERFGKSAEKCRDNPEAQAAHQRRYRQAERIWRMVFPCE
ncbi:MAG: histidine phosphatase family protein [Lachnospiraceae bacterium]|nr:histidine phosphatase family protein [Lachnospiraceae bacterium]